MSVRTWDLRHSPRLQAQFPGPPTRIAELDDGELAQVATEWRELAELVESAGEDLRQLLRNPFNLRLAAELLLAGTALTELRDIRDRLELLNRYWEHRVSDEPGGIGRYILLARTCEYTATNRTLSAPVAQVLAADAGAAQVLAELLSRSVLVEPTGLPGNTSVGAVRFADHVLYDYALAVTLFGETEDAFIRRLQADHDLVLFARPSLDIHLERLWAADPARFWRVADEIASDDALPRLATVAVAEVAARRSRRCSGPCCANRTGRVRTCYARTAASTALSGARRCHRPRGRRRSRPRIVARGCRAPVRKRRRDGATSPNSPRRPRATSRRPDWPRSPRGAASRLGGISSSSGMNRRRL